MTEFVQLAADAATGIIARAADAIVAADTEQRIVFFNAAAETMFGCNAGEMIGAPVRRIIAEDLHVGPPPPDRPANAAFAGIPKAANLVVVTGVRAGGAQFPIEATVTQLEAGGRPVCVAIVRDITDRWQMIETLRRSEQAFAETFAQSPIGIMCVTPEGTIERANDVLIKLFGRPAHEVLGKSVVDLHDNPERVNELQARLAAGETVHDFHLHAQTPEGLKYLLVDASGTRERGPLARSRWFVRDITSRVKLEVEILTIAENERQRIGQDLHDDVCQQLVAIEYMVEAMAAGLNAHSRPAEQAHDISFHLRAVIDRTRAIARGMAPSFPEQPDGLMIALQELADRTTKVFKRDCRFECPKTVLSPDRATTMHLYRIAQEAVNNAIKHGQARHITIHLFLNGSALVLCVTDDGNGGAPNLEKRQGMGLRVMQYRAGVIGGTLAIQRKPKEGTSVICTVKAPAVKPPEGP